MNASMNRNEQMLSRRTATRIMIPVATGEDPWALPPRRLLLEEGSLHIWRASLDLPPAARARTEDVLSEPEREQCARLVRPTDRARCAAARAFLRAVLAKYVGESPRALSIEVGPRGKPSLECSAGIQFNISHTADLALIAVTRGLRVGIDIERVRQVQNMEGILGSFFSERERAYLHSRPAEERTGTFLTLWTRHEAAAKALGIGLIDSFSQFTLPLSGHDRSGFPLVLAAVGAGSRGSDGWWMRDLIPAPECAGALCVERKNPEPSFWIFTPA